MSTCTHAPGLCMRSANCPDLACPGRPIPGLHTSDGGVTFNSGVVFPITCELAEPTPDDSRPEILGAIAGALIGLAGGIAMAIRMQVI